MIVISMKLQSALGRDRDADLGTLLIGNDGTGTNSRGNYEVRAYKKGDLAKAEGNGFRLWHSGPKPTRTAFVEGHARLAQPVGDLVQKALTALGYG